MPGTLQLKLIVAGLVAAALIGTGLYIRSLKSKLAECESVNAQLSASIRLQNDAIDQLRVEGEQRLAKAEKDLAEAKAQAEKNRSQARIIYKTKPSDPSNLCKSALDLMNGGAK